MIYYQGNVIVLNVFITAGDLSALSVIVGEVIINQIDPCAMNVRAGVAVMRKRLSSTTLTSTPG